MSAPMTEATPFVPSGHPVRRFVVVLTAMCAALAALWWSGLANPRLSVSHAQSTFDEDAGRGTLRAQMRNETRSAVELSGVTFDDPWIHLQSAQIAGADIERRPSLRAHDTASLELTFTVDCAALAEPQRLDPTGTIYSDELLRVRAQATMGGQRTRTAEVRGALNV